MKMFYSYFLSVILSLFASCAFAEVASIRSQLQEITDTYLKNHASPEQEYISAVSLAVKTPAMKKPLTVESGYTDMTHATPVTASNLYQIGSITKSFLAVIFLQLEFEGKLSINDPIGKYLPDCPPQWAGVTIKQLLNMTSGIPTYTSEIKFSYDIGQNPQQHFQADDLIAYVKNQNLLFIPGSSWFYSNTDYILAEEIIENITHEHLKAVLTQRIFKPLHLQHTYYIPDSYPFYPPYIYARMVHGYYNMQEDVKYWPLQTDITSWTVSWGRGAGAIIANTTDMIIWAEALLPSTSQLLPKKQRNELTSLVSTKTGQAFPQSNPTINDNRGYGLGIRARYSPGETIYFVSGGSMGYRTLSYYFPHEKIFISVGLNSGTGDPDHTSETGFIMSVYNVLLMRVIFSCSK